ncbi:MAG: hypothetical protein RIC16_04455 [Rhodospirillales bacterium]
MYRGYDLATELSAFGEFAPFVEHWRGKLGDGGRLPSWTDFRSEEMMHWWGRLSLLRYQDDPFDIHCDLFGTKASEWFGEDMTNVWLGSNDRYRLWWPQEREYYVRLKDGALIGMSGGGVAIRGRYSHSICSVELPIRNSQGTLSLFSYYTETPKGEVLEIDAEPAFEFSVRY